MRASRAHTGGDRTTSNTDLPGAIDMQWRTPEVHVHNVFQMPGNLNLRLGEPGCGKFSVFVYNLFAASDTFLLA